MILTSKIFISQTQNWIFFRNPSVLLAFKSKRLWPKFCGIYETIVVNDSWYFFKRPGGLESSLVRHIFCLFYIDVKTPSSCHHKIWIIEIAQDKNIIALTSVAFFLPSSATSVATGTIEIPVTGVLDSPRLHVDDNWLQYIAQNEIRSAGEILPDYRNVYHQFSWEFFFFLQGSWCVPSSYF